LRGGSSDKYHYLNIPGIIEEDTGSAEYYDKLCKKQAYTHAKPILYNLNRSEKQSALWPSRKSLVSLLAMKEANPYTYNSQYAGDPSAQGVGLVQEDWWQEYDPASFDWKSISHTFITADTASTAKTYSDYSVLIQWAVQKVTRNVYAKNIMLGKFETPELKEEIIKFWKMCNTLDMRWPQLLPRALHMEDKSSGQFLNQQFLKEGNIRCIPVPRDKTAGDKLARFLNTLPYFSQKRIFFPAGHEHLEHCKREILSMTSLGSGTGHDDVCDNVSDMAAIEFSGVTANYEAWV
jgi:predicted phage terminase large subunit-like protein